MTVGAQHRKISSDVVFYWLALLQGSDWLKVMGFDEPFSDRAIALRKIQIASLTDGTVMLFGIL